MKDGNYCSHNVGDAYFDPICCLNVSSVVAIAVGCCCCCCSVGGYCGVDCDDVAGDVVADGGCCYDDSDNNFKPAYAYVRLLHHRPMKNFSEYKPLHSGLDWTMFV